MSLPINNFQYQCLIEQVLGKICTFLLRLFAGRTSQVSSKNLKYLDRNIDYIHVNSFHLISVKKYYSYPVYIYLVYIAGWIHRSFHSFSGKTQLLLNYNVRGETTTVYINVASFTYLGDDFQHSLGERKTIMQNMV